MRVPILPAAFASLLALSTSVSAQITKAPAVKTKQAIKVETFAKGLVHPWGMAFLPDGRLLVTERPGRLRIVGKDGRLSAETWLVDRKRYVEGVLLSRLAVSSWASWEGYGLDGS